MAMTFTQIRETTFEELQANAGVVLSDFDPATFEGTLTRTKILFATSGGITFKDTPEYRDAGEGIDNAPKNVKELKKFVRRDIKVTGSKVTFTPESVKLDMAAADATDVTKTGSTIKKLTPRDTLADSDFTDFWIVGDYGDGGYFAVHVMNALSTGGFAWKTADNGNGTSDFEYTAHYTLTDPTKVPYEAYLMTPASGS